MRLNPTKCVFRVSSGKFLGFMVLQRGIEANPKKVEAILDMTSPRSVKEIQRLTGLVVALNRFVSRTIDKCFPFFKTLKQVSNGWRNAKKLSKPSNTTYPNHPS